MKNVLNINNEIAVAIPFLAGVRLTERTNIYNETTYIVVFLNEQGNPIVSYETTNHKKALYVFHRTEQAMEKYLE